jgi:hypothetical protein
MPPKRVPVSAVGISPRETRLANRSQANVSAPKRSKSTLASHRASQATPAAIQNQPQLTGDQFGTLLQSVEALTAAVRAQYTPAPVASDNRRAADVLQESTVDDPWAFNDTGIDDFAGVSVTEGMSHLHSILICLLLRNYLVLLGNYLELLAMVTMVFASIYPKLGRVSKYINYF